MSDMHMKQMGFDGSYGRVAAFARDWHEDYRRQQQMSGKGTYVPLSFAPGEAFQFDWSEDWAIIDGVRPKLQVAHFKLGYSRAFLAAKRQVKESGPSERVPPFDKIIEDEIEQARPMASQGPSQELIDKANALFAQVLNQEQAE